MNNRNLCEICVVKKHMGDLAPMHIIADNKRHVYTVKIKGRIRKASYIAVRNPFGDLGPAMICSYGLLDEEERMLIHFYCNQSF